MTTVSRAVRRAAVYGLGTMSKPFAPRRRFILLADPRTGSVLLGDLLDSQPGVQCEGELLAMTPRRPVLALEGRSVLSSARQRSQAYGLSVMGRHVRRYVETFGEPLFIDELRDRGWLIVRLCRRNLLLQSLSLIHGLRNQMHYRVDDFIEHAPMTVDPVEVIGVMANLENDAGWISEVVPNPDVSIVYEDDLQEPESQQATLDRLAPYLGIELPKIATKIQRVNAPTTKARLSNFAEVEAVLRSTRFARFLDSPELSAQPPGPRPTPV